jgi:hypothetical protein
MAWAAEHRVGLGPQISGDFSEVLRALAER